MIILKTIIQICLISAALSRGEVGIGTQTFFVEIAKSDQDWERGLMFRDKLADKEGMLFWGTADRAQSFWMKNTPLSLDIIFLQNDGTIVTIHSHTEPFSEKLLPSSKPARHVLELKAGTAKKLKLKVGDKIRLPK